MSLVQLEMLLLLVLLNGVFQALPFSAASAAAAAGANTGRAVMRFSSMSSALALTIRGNTAVIANTV